MTETLRDELRGQVGFRVSVLWHCGQQTRCTTGHVTQVGLDYLELRGLVPTFAESIATCTDLAPEVLQTLIPLSAICAVVENVPAGRKADFEPCCLYAPPTNV